jgi:hypothetical protein
VTDQHDPTAPRCDVCHKRPPAADSQVCNPCQTGLATDLDAIPDLAALLPAAVAPSLAQPMTIGSRSTEVPLPGGDALNLTAVTNDEVPVHLIPQVRVLRTVDTWEIEHAGRIITVAHTTFTREYVIDDDGRPLLIPDGDQCGDLGPWVMVARWTAHWARLRGGTEVGTRGIGWLRERLDWACRAHPDIGGWAAELRHVVGGMRAVLDLRRHVVRYRDRCPRCDASGTLFRWVDPMLLEDDPRVRYICCANRECGTMFELDDERIGNGRRAA